MMVQAIIAGLKWQTRRIINPQPDIHGLHDHTRFSLALDDKLTGWRGDTEDSPIGESREFRPKAQPGDIIWAREAIYCHPFFNRKDADKGFCGDLFEKDGSICAFRGYMADGLYHDLFKKIPSIHMPKAAARIWLACSYVTAQRAQDISEADCISEGILPPVNGFYYNYLTKQYSCCTAYESFRSLWQHLHAKPPKPGKVDGRWEANPWVWVYHFRTLSTTGKPSNI